MIVSSLYIGTSGWAYPEWVGPFYPDDMEPGRFLELYATKFRAVEIDSTFYRTPSRAMVDGWRRRVPDGFYFAALAPKAVSHAPDLRGISGELAQFLNTMEHLGGKLGPIVFEFPASFSLARFHELEKFLRALPQGFRIALEMRDAEWRNLGMFHELLQELNVAIAITAFPGEFPAATTTADFKFIRWAGRKNAPALPKIKRIAEIAHWATRIEKNIAAGRIVYGFFANVYSGHAPASAHELLSSIQALRKNISPPETSINATPK
jgi:uncharacterized protein YecE (DUF72 family)